MLPAPHALPRLIGHKHQVNQAFLNAVVEAVQALPVVEIYMASSDR